MSESSERYTHGHHESVLRSHTWRTIANSAAYLEPHLRPGASLLDAGCGPGTITAEFAGRLAPGRVVGLDASAEVIARAAADAAGPEYLVGDVYSIPFDDDTFDIAHAHQVLQHVGDPVAALREMGRVVRPGGVVAVRDVDYAGTVWFPASPALTRWLELYEEVARSNGGEPDAGRRLQSWAHAAGLRDIRATASVWCFANADDRAWVGRDVGRPGAAVRVRERRARQRTRDAGRAERDLGPVATLGRQRRRGAHHAARRDPGDGVIRPV